ncbi:MAG: DUF2207 domain-containing protein [Peptostreptococcaceae bacterium]|nr:DUF2207 domain-containing protein [Peptostreptococcaceae bacterium]
MSAQKKKIMQRNLWHIAMLLFLFIIVPQSAFAAEEIRSITIDMLLNDDGSADITQIWDVETHQGTEFYFTMSNMGDMEVKDFKVKDETGREFVFSPDWNTKASLEEKAYRCGFHKIKGGFEMCWGKGSYGNHTYTLNYRLTNLVKSYPDYDGFNTRLVNDKMTPAVQKAKVNIRFSDESKNSHLTADEVGIWAFGYRGSIVFGESAIVAETDEPIQASDYLNVMVRLPKGLIHPNSQGKGSFEKLQKEAFKGSDYAKFGNKKIYLALIAGIVIAAAVWRSRLKQVFLRKAFRKMGGKLNGSGYCRKISRDKNLSTAYWSLSGVGVRVSERELLQAYLIKLIKNHAIKIKKVEPSNENGYSHFEMTLNADAPLEESSERNLLELLIGATGAYNTLTEGELKKYLSENPNTADQHPVTMWMEDVKINGSNNFFDLGGYDEIPGNYFKMKKITLFQGGFEYIQEILNFKKFLNNFTKISEREAHEVELWDDYLVFATLFGIADQVAKQMRKINPTFEERSAVMNKDYSLTKSAVHTFSSVYESSRAAGKGGSSSSGGGGGYSGGGSGGGSR